MEQLVLDAVGLDSASDVDGRHWNRTMAYVRGHAAHLRFLELVVAVVTAVHVFAVIPFNVLLLATLAKGGKSLKTQCNVVIAINSVACIAGSLVILPARFFGYPHNQNVFLVMWTAGSLVMRISNNSFFVVTVQRFVLVCLGGSSWAGKKVSKAPSCGGALVYAAIITFPAAAFVAALYAFFPATGVAFELGFEDANSTTLVAFQDLGRKPSLLPTAEHGFAAACAVSATASLQLAATFFFYACIVAATVRSTMRVRRQQQHNERRSPMSGKDVSTAVNLTAQLIVLFVIFASTTVTISVSGRTVALARLQVSIAASESALVLTALIDPMVCTLLSENVRTVMKKKLQLLLGATLPADIASLPARSFFSKIASFFGF